MDMTGRSSIARCGDRARRRLTALESTSQSFQHVTGFRLQTPLHDPADDCREGAVQHVHSGSIDVHEVVGAARFATDERGHAKRGVDVVRGEDLFACNDDSRPARVVAAAQDADIGDADDWFGSKAFL
jgi:hypothetical protein